ncbi:MAG: glycosyltransferase family 2 protein [Methylococcaceae bacterium]|nr:glycosyltransferase family 2 protein [Methylococcaceae bacterium]
MTSEMVTVLMSTYNGGSFLQQQLNSLYAQTYPNVKILVRDDGSTDTTRDLLTAECLTGAIEQLEDHNNLGATGSFFTLLRHAAQTKTAYVAFCDQDDVWQANKIEQAVSMLASVSDRPALYCSRLEIVDEQLHTLNLSISPRKIGFGNALVENIAVGCTMVLNRKAIELLCQQALPNTVYVHDWWCYLVISCFGEVVFDDHALIKYRQHGGNVIGAATNSLGVLKRKFARLFNNRLWISEQAVIFLQLFADRLPFAQRELVELLVKSKSSVWCRIRLALSTAVWRQKGMDNFILRLVILMNRI